jgi:hypothetical protein
MKLTFLPSTPSVFLSTHADGRVRLFDLRAPRSATSATDGVLVQLPRASGSASDLAFDPASPHTFALGSNDPVVRLFDVRALGGEVADASAAQPLAELLPPPVEAALRAGGAAARALDGVSGLAWAPRSLLAASYRGADVYTLDCSRLADSAARASACQQPPDARFERRFSGRRNVRTFLKGVAFLARGAYLAVGGDCGCVYVWHTASGALAARLEADAQVLNCVAPHPDGLPLMAVSGIDSDVKVMAPAWPPPRAPWRPPRGAHLVDDPDAGAPLAGIWDSAAAAAAEAAAAAAREQIMRQLLLRQFGIAVDDMGGFDEDEDGVAEEEEEVATASSASEDEDEEEDEDEDEDEDSFTEEEEEEE